MAKGIVLSRDLLLFTSPLNPLGFGDKYLKGYRVYLRHSTIDNYRIYVMKYDLTVPEPDKHVYILRRSDQNAILLKAREDDLYGFPLPGMKIYLGRYGIETFNSPNYKSYRRRQQIAKRKRR